MTRKIYKSAMGKTIDLGSLILQNENTRAVGNMNVNARGDLLDGNNQVIDKKNRQIQRQYKRTTNVTNSTPVQSSARAAKQSAMQAKNIEEQKIDSIEEILPIVEEPVNYDVAEPITEPPPVDPSTIPAQGGGLAAAIARSRLIKQEKEKTLKEKQQAQGIRKI